jgi:hypothetical protein
MIQVSVGQPFEQVPQAAPHAVHHIRLAEALQANSSALRAARMGPQVETIRPRQMLLALAHAALKDPQIGKALDQRAVDPPQLASAVYALSHWACANYGCNSICGTGTTGVTIKSSPFPPKPKSLCSTESPCMVRGSTI